MVTTAKVHLWNQLVGVVLWEEKHNMATFEYAPDFIQSRLEVSPLRMPLSSRIYSFPELSRQTFMGLPGLLAEALPDAFGRALLDQWLRMQKRQMNIKHAASIIDRVVEAVSKWPQLAAEYHLNPDIVHYIESTHNYLKN